MNPNKLKEEGNKLFARQNFREAIERYTEALEKAPDNCVLYTNRALCFIKLSKWSQVIQDCKHALELDSNSLKAYFYLGQAQIECAQFDEAIFNLQKSEELNKQLNSTYGDEIRRTIKVAKRKRWNHLEEEKVKQELELQIYLNNLMKEDRDRHLKELQENTMEHDNFDNSIIQQINKDYENKVTELNKLFEENDIRRKKREIPDYLCDKISFELIQDPVITPSGVTYNRNEIEQHIQRIGHFDPITRQPLTLDQLIPNLLVKEIIEDFVAKNPWIDGAM